MLNEEILLFIEENPNEFIPAIELIHKQMQSENFKHTHRIELSNGSFLFFNEKGCYINNMQESRIATFLPDKTVKYELIRNEKYIEITAKIHKFHMGEDYPERFDDVIESIKDKDIVTFNSGKSYMCLKNNKKMTFMQTYEGNDEFSIEKFIDSKIYHIDLKKYNRKEYKRFYDDATDRKLINASLRNISRQSILKELAEIKKRTKIEKLMHFNIGKIRITAKKDKFGYKFFDNNGKCLKEDLLIKVLGWANTAPVYYSLKNPEIYSSDILKQKVLLNTIENMNKSGCYQNLVEYIKDKCPNNNQFEIKMNTLMKKNIDYIDTSIVFSKEQEISSSEFVKLCEQKYNSIQNFFTNKLKKIIINETKIFSEKDIIEVEEAIDNLIIAINSEIGDVRKASNNQRLIELLEREETKV